MAVRANDAGGAETGWGTEVSIWFSAINTKKLFPGAPRDIEEPSLGPVVYAGALKPIRPSASVMKSID